MALVIAIAAVMAAGIAPKVGAQQPDTVRIAFRYDQTGFPLVVADQLGFFAKEGIQADFKILDEKTAYAALLKGDVDVVTLVSAATVNLYLSGAPIKVIMKLGDGGRQVIISNFGAKSIRDLVGKTVGMFRPTTAFTYFVFQDEVRKAGLDEKQFNVVFFDRATPAQDALLAGKVDALIQHEVAGIELASFGFSHVRLSQTVLPSKNGIVVTDRFLANPDLAKRFIKAVREATQWLKSHPAEATKMLGDFYSDVVYKRDVRQTAPLVYRLFREIWSATGAWSDADLLLLADYLTRPVQPSLIDPAYANQSLVGYLRQLFTNDYLK